jgi:hypothetical protein
MDVKLNKDEISKIFNNVFFQADGETRQSFCGFEVYKERIGPKTGEKYTDLHAFLPKVPCRPETVLPFVVDGEYTNIVLEVFYNEKIVLETGPIRIEGNATFMDIFAYIKNNASESTGANGPTIGSKEKQEPSEKMKVSVYGKDLMVEKTGKSKYTVTEIENNRIVDESTNEHKRAVLEFLRMISNI